MSTAKHAAGIKQMSALGWRHSMPRRLQKGREAAVIDRPLTLRCQHVSAHRPPNQRNADHYFLPTARARAVSELWEVRRAAIKRHGRA